MQDFTNKIKIFNELRVGSLIKLSNSEPIHLFYLPNGRYTESIGMLESEELVLLLEKKDMPPYYHNYWIRFLTKDGKILWSKLYSCDTWEVVL